MVVASIAATPAAAEVEFLPSLEASYGIDGNPSVTGRRGQAERDEDGVAALAVALALQVRRPTVDIELVYRPYFDVYATQSDNDNVGHRLDFRYGETLDRRSKVSLAASASRTERQGLSPDAPSAPVSLVPRTRSTTGSIDLGHAVSVGDRWSWNWSLGGALTRYDADGDATAQLLEDSASGTFGAGFSRALSRTATIGATVTYELQDYETRADTRVAGVRVTSGYRSSAATSWQFELGVQRAEARETSDWSPAASVTVDRQVGERSALTAGANRSVSRGTGLSGATSDTGAFVGYAYAAPRRWAVDTQLGYWDREGLELDGAGVGEDLRAFLVASGFRWFVNDYISVGVRHEYRDQRSGAAAGTEFLDASYHSGSILFGVSRERRAGRAGG